MANDEQDIQKALEKAEKAGKTFKAVAQNFTTPLDLIIDKFEQMGDEGSATGKVLAGVFAAVGIAISSALKSSQDFVRTLGQIKGINGNVGQLAKAITAAATGSVSKQDIADFLAATSDLFTNAQAQQNQLGLIQKMIAAYGDVNVAAEKFRNILVLSAESQEAVVSAIEKQAKAMENTPEGRLRAIQKDLQEILTMIGTDLMYVLKPVLAFIAAISDAMKTLADSTALEGTRAQQLQTEIDLTEEEKKALQELNDIELGGFTSSLDEVRETGSGGPRIDEDATGLGLGITPEGVEEVDDSFQTLKETFSDIVEALVKIWGAFSDLMSLIGPGLLDMISWVLQLGAGFFEWADSMGILEPSLIAIAGAIMAVKVANALAAIAQRQHIAAIAASLVPISTQTGMLGANAAAGMAAAGASSFGTAIPIILAAISAGVAGLSALGVFSGSSVPSGSIDTGFSDTQSLLSEREFVVYLDGKKVNDGLAQEARLNEEVIINR